MKGIYYKLFIFLLTLMLAICAVPVFAETSVPQLPDRTPTIVDSSASPEATPGTGTNEGSPDPSEATVTPAPTPDNRGETDAFDGTPDNGTGNSAGAIIFMVVIVLFCLFFVIEAVVHWIRKKGR